MDVPECAYIRNWNILPALPVHVVANKIAMDGTLRKKSFKKTYVLGMNEGALHIDTADNDWFHAAC